MRTNERYVLDAKGQPVEEPDLLTWAQWFEKSNDRHLGYDKLPGDITISTVFLGLDHSFGGPVPLLWETMIFGGPEDQYQERYSTREEALAGHAKAVARAKSSNESSNGAASHSFYGAEGGT